MNFCLKHRVSTNAGLGHENGDMCTAAFRFPSARTVSLGEVSVLSKGRCESCGTEVDEPVRELIREQSIKIDWILGTAHLGRVSNVLPEMIIL